MFNKKLKRRLKSLENTLGLKYIPGDDVKNFCCDENHIVDKDDSWSLMARFQDFIDEQKKKKK